MCRIVHLQHQAAKNVTSLIVIDLSNKTFVTTTIDIKVA